MNLRNNNVELKKIKKPGCRGITQRDSAQVKLRNPQLNNMLLRPRRRRVQITKKSKRMNNSKRRAEFLYWGQGIKRGWGGSRTQGQDTCLCLWVGGGSTGTFCLFIIYTSMSMHISSRKKGANGEGKKLMQWDRGQ